MKDCRARLLGFCVLSVCFLLADPTSATTIIPMSDEDLVASSQVIVEGRCLRITPEWNSDRTAIFTRIMFRVTKVIKGDIQPGTIVLRQLGGQVSDGATIIWGAPYWQKGWEMLLFLNPEPDEGFRVAHLSLGYFRVLSDSTTGAKFVARSSPGPNVRVLGDRPFERCEPLDTFVTRIGSLVAGGEPRHRPPGGPSKQQPAALSKSGHPSSDFRFLSPGFRWFEPDAGDRILFRVNRSRAPSPSGGVDEAKAAARAWSEVPGSSLRAEISGETDACGLRADGTNAISFNDCTGRFDPPVNCSGVVAVGGVAQAVASQSVSLGGRTFVRIQDADVIFNPGFECILGDSTILSEIMTHEMGHTFGFAHSSDQIDESSMLLRDATLFLQAHLDGRGASLRADDMDGARFLYRAAPSTDPLAIVTDALPDAQTGTPYAFDLKATGSGPFTWSLVDGQLPDPLGRRPSFRHGHRRFSKHFHGNGAGQRQLHAHAVSATPLLGHSGAVRRVGQIQQFDRKADHHGAQRRRVGGDLRERCSGSTAAHRQVQAVEGTTHRQWLRGGSQCSGGSAQRHRHRGSRSVVEYVRVLTGASAPCKRSIHAPTHALPRTVLIREARDFKTGLNVTGPSSSH